MGNKYSLVRIGNLAFPIYWAFPDRLMALYQKGELIKSVSRVQRETDEWYDISGIYVDGDDSGATVIHELYLQTQAATLLDRIRLLRGETGAVRSAFDRLYHESSTTWGDSAREPLGPTSRVAYELDDYQRDVRSAVFGDSLVWADRSPPPNPAWLLDSIFGQERLETFERLFIDWLAIISDASRGASVVVEVLDLIADSVDEARLLRDIEAAYSRPSPDRDDFTEAPLIVFTEGRTDARWLSQSVSGLRPDLAEFVRFFNYEQSRTGGGTNEVVKLIRALSEVGVASQMLVLLDNDTAGHEAKAALRSSSLRSNIRVRSLPPLDDLRSYPTLGPTGLETLDINGRAAAIECYFGEDVLRDQDACLTPIQWTGWNANLRQYQGELVGKRQVQKRVQHKLRQLERGNISGDWSGIEQVIDTILMSGHGRQVE